MLEGEVGQAPPLGVKRRARQHQNALRRLPPERLERRFVVAHLAHARHLRLQPERMGGRLGRPHLAQAGDSPGARTPTRRSAGTAVFSSSRRLAVSSGA